jgi:hypothetical protein
MRYIGVGTLVRLTHRGLPPDEVANHRAGWSHYLTGSRSGPPAATPAPTVAPRPVDRQGAPRSRAGRLPLPLALAGAGADQAARAEHGADAAAPAEA